jgi:uncharacterized protein GlcG (DUF336 family)
MAVISASQVRTIMDTVLKTARKKKLPQMAVAVVDAGGHVLGYLAEDRSAPLRFEIARGKAWTAAMRAEGTTRLAEQAARNPVLVSSLQSMNPHYLPVRGGVLLRDTKGEIAGAIGVTGATAEQDEACALAGAKAAKLKGEP